MMITKEEAAQLIFRRVEDLKKEKSLILVAIDGRCGSGKSTLAGELFRRFGWKVVHLDDYYLQPHQRTEARYRTPGANVDLERLTKELLEPLSQKRDGIYRPYVFPERRFLEEAVLRPEGVIVLEGSYSMNPSLRRFYDLSVFTDIAPEKQQERILGRNGPEGLGEFNRRWIPLEELYFVNCEPKKACDLILRIDEV